MPNRDRVQKRKLAELSEAASGSDRNVMRKFVWGCASLNR